MKIVEECFAAHGIEDHYDHKIFQGQQYVLGNVLERTRLTKNRLLFKEKSKKNYLRKHCGRFCSIFYIENGTIFNQQ